MDPLAVTKGALEEAAIMNLRLFSVKSKNSRFAGVNIVAESAEDAINFVWPKNEPTSGYAKKRENMIARDITANHASTLGPIFAQKKKGRIVWSGKTRTFAEILEGKKSEPWGWAFIDEMQDA